MYLHVLVVCQMERDKVLRIKRNTPPLPHQHTLRRKKAVSLDLEKGYSRKGTYRILKFSN